MERTAMNGRNVSQRAAQPGLRRWMFDHYILCGTSAQTLLPLRSSVDYHAGNVLHSFSHCETNFTVELRRKFRRSVVA